jgi:hypothetical protein
MAMEEKAAAIFLKMRGATVLRPGRSGSRGVARRTMFLPSKVPSLWRIDIVVWRHSHHSVVRRFVLGSKPEIPAPVFFVPSGLTKVKSDSGNLPSYWLPRAFRHDRLSIRR